MEINLIPISKEEVKQYVTLAFEGDRDLLETYHISPGDLDHCVSHTCGFIEENKDFFGDRIEICKVELRDNEKVEDIGFTAIILHNDKPNELYSFGIAKQFRKQEILTLWLKEIESILLLPYFIVLWSKNTRAIEFFKRNEFEVEEKDELTKLIVKCE